MRLSIKLSGASAATSRSLNLVLRQHDWPDDDSVIVVHRNYEDQFLDSLCDFLGIGSVTLRGVSS